MLTALVAKSKSNCKTDVFLLDHSLLFPSRPLGVFSALANLSAMSITTPIKTLYNEGKMHHHGHPAVSHPTFPGNVEALSVLASLPELRYSHESSPWSSSSSLAATTTPISPPESTATSQKRSLGPNQSSKPKRRQTLAACRPCRKHKSRVCASSAARNKSTSMPVTCLHRDLTHDLSVTVSALDAAPASTEPLPASTRSEKAKHSSKPLEKNSKPTERLCSCYEGHRFEIQK
jgi:hypothetical protein